MKDRLYSTTEVLKIVGISRRTLHYWLTKGLIQKPKRNGRGYLFWDREQLIRLKEFVRERYTVK